MAPKKKSPPAGNIQPQEATAKLGPNTLTISFDHPDQVLPKLLEVAQHFSDDHAAILSGVGPSDDVLGGARARIIVSGCAKSTAFGATLGDLGLNLQIFKKCVSDGVAGAGYVPPPNIPASLNTTLLTVVAAIQGAPHTVA